RRLLLLPRLLTSPSFLGLIRCSSVSLACLLFFNDTATTEIYTLSLHDALPISASTRGSARGGLPSLGVGFCSNGDAGSGSAAVSGIFGAKSVMRASSGFLAGRRRAASRRCAISARF